VTRLGERLAGVQVPDAEGAAHRARAVVLETYAAREPVPARHRRSALRLVLGATCAVLLLVGVAVASPGTETIIRSVREAVAPKAVPHTAAPLQIPGGGSLLVRLPGALLIQRADGSRLMLGDYRDASWSPHARFIVASAGPHLVAIDPRTGKNRWTITAAAPVSAARWSLEPTVPPCCRIAYLSAGAVHVIAGDGTGERVLAPADDRVAPAWRPRSRDRALAFATPSGAVRVESVETGRTITRVREPFRPKAIAWSSDGTRLLVLGATQLVVLDLDGHRGPRRIAPKPGSTLVSAAFVGKGHAIVLLRRLGGGRSSIVLVPAKGPGRPLVTLVGTLAGLAPSPDGKHVLVGWSAAGQWLLVPVTGTDRARNTIALASRLGRTPQLIADSWRSTR
jgi:hypothetical protein